MILRWHSSITHLVTLFLIKAIGHPLPTIYRHMWSSGRGKCRLTYVVYFVKSKIGPSESCNTSYSDHWEMDNQGWGRKMDTTQV